MEVVDVERVLKHDVSGITDDSRELEEDFLFSAHTIALPFVEHALSMNPAGIIISYNDYLRLDEAVKRYREEHGITLILTGDAALLQGYLTSALYDHPSHDLELVGVTGTNGKTSISHMAYHLWKEMGMRCGVIGTLGAKWVRRTADGMEEHFEETGYTTPRPQILQPLLRKMRNDGVGSVFLEVSSEALDLGRVDGLRFSSVIFTNLTQDHLDHHGNMENYFESKKRLFTISSRDFAPIFIINTVDSYGKRLLEEAHQLPHYMVASVSEPFVNKLSLPGDFNRMNASLALLGAFPDTALVVQKRWPESVRLYVNRVDSTGVTDSSPSSPIDIAIPYIFTENEEGHRENDLVLNRVLQLMETIPPVPGRFNMILSEHTTAHKAENKFPDYSGVVDYAHTPDALENLLSEVRKMGVRSLCTVFGCGGDRDRGKRPLMGEIAQKFSDYVIVTDDNPRTENPSDIRQEILTGLKNSLENQDSELYTDEGDRRKAIEMGARWLAKQTELPAMLVVAGKGHENYQIYGQARRDFLDGEELKNALDQVFLPR